MVIPSILTTDTIDQWRVKDNQAITALNNEGINSIVQILNAMDQDILVYDASTGFFVNTGVAAFITATINSLASFPVSNLKPFYYASLRTVF